MDTALQHGRNPYAAFGMVVIASSAGGISALLLLLKDLPRSFPIPIIVVQHLPTASRYISKLDHVLQSRTALQVKWAENGERPLPGIVYLAPQDRNTVLNIQTGCLMVVGGAKVSRPAADPLFRSAAEIYGSRAVAVVLSGALSDGADGSAAIASAGGRVLVQAASEAQFDDMPSAAMKRSRVGFALDSTSLGCLIANLVMAPGVAAWFGIGKAGVGAEPLASVA